MELLRHAVQEGFIRCDDLALPLVAATPRQLLDALAGWSPPARARVWLSPAQA